MLSRRGCILTYFSKLHIKMTAVLRLWREQFRENRMTASHGKQADGSCIFVAPLPPPPIRGWKLAPSPGWLPDDELWLSLKWSLIPFTQNSLSNISLSWSLWTFLFQIISTDDVAKVLSLDEIPKGERETKRRARASNSHKSDLFIYKLIDFFLHTHTYWFCLNQEVTKQTWWTKFKSSQLFHWLLKRFNYLLLL